VLDVDGRAARLSRYLHDRITLLGFIYTPAPIQTAAAGLPRIRCAEGAIADALTSTESALVTLSFDPARDTPEASAAMRGAAWWRLMGACAGISSPPAPRVSCFRWWGIRQDVRVSAAGRELSHVLKGS